MSSTSTRIKWFSQQRESFLYKKRAFTQANFKLLQLLLFLVVPNNMNEAVLGHVGTLVRSSRDP